MEKRLLLAFALSFTILFIWSGLNRPKTNKSQSLDKINASDNKSSFVTSENAASENSLNNNQTLTESVVNKAFPAKTNVLKNDKLTIEFTNSGGGFNKIVLNHLDATIPIKKVADFSFSEDKEFKLDRMDKDSVYYSLHNNGLGIYKMYKLISNDYIVQSEIKIKNESAFPIKLDVSKIFYEINFKNEIADKNHWAQEHGRDQSLYEYVIYSQSGIARKNNAYKFTPKEDKISSDKIDWVGFRTRYICAIIKPNFTTINYKIEEKEEHVLAISADQDNLQLNPGDEKAYSFTNYFGPEDTKTLKAYGFEFEKIKRFYRLSLFDIPAKIIYALLHFLYNFIKNWGACILLIATIIYGVTYPLTLKSMASMKKMQELQPKMAILKEKYKDNPQRLNKEMMEIYKENKINPLAGCIPVLLQMPVFIGLYQVLWRDPSFKGAEFLWIKDLSMPDRLIQKIPGIGIDLNILPILMCVIMFVQQKITTKNMVFADPDQAAQQKMMAKIMPIMMGFLFYQFASGINLYFTLFYLFSAITQFKMSKVKNV